MTQIPQEPVEIDLKDIDKSDIATMYEVRLLCADCKQELNRTKPLSGKELHDNWLFIVMGSPLMNNQCPKGCRSTFTDCNMNTKHQIVYAGDYK